MSTKQGPLQTAKNGVHRSGARTDVSHAENVPTYQTHVAFEMKSDECGNNPPNKVYSYPKKSIRQKAQ
jgi:hypothetical protein